MTALIEIAIALLSDVCGFAVLLFRPSGALVAENLFRRRQLALYQERGVRPHRIDAATRITLAWLSRRFDWRAALVVVRPETLVRWHRAGFRLLWRVKSRVGRPPIPLELRRLIRRLAAENQLWGEERIANELLVKLGLRVSPRTVRKYLPRRPPRLPRGDQRWSTFLRNHAHAIVACDFFLVVTATFRQLYVFVMIEYGSRRLVHMNVTPHPTAVWTLQQLREAIAFGDRYRATGCGFRSDSAQRGWTSTWDGKKWLRRSARCDDVCRGAKISVWRRRTGSRRDAPTVEQRSRAGDQLWQ